MKADHYKNCSLEELAADPAFQAWVLNPTDESTSFWEAFLEGNPQKKPLVRNAQTLVRSVQEYFQKEKLSEEQLSQYYEQIKRRATVNQQTVNIRPFFPFSRIAAAVAILVLAGLAYLFYRSNISPTEVYRTAYGQRKKMELPDGTLVELNAHSQLKLGKNWKRGDREVWLEGEAFFTVAKRKDARFTVHTQGLDIEVLGTQFNVNTRRENTQVLLEEGKVKLRAQNQQHNNEEMYLQPGELAAYSKKTGQITKQQLEGTANYLSWKEGYLIYEKATIAEVIHDMQATYGMNVRITDSLLLEKTIRGALPTDNLNEFLTMVETLFGVEATRSNDTIHLELKSD